jgi:alpha-L-rhamnosidase
LISRRLGVAVLSAALVGGPAVAATAAPQAANFAPHGLRVDSLTAPLGIDDTTPSLSWQLPDSGSASVQTAYEVRAASSPDRLGQPDLWDSGKVTSQNSIHVPWAGARLDSREQVSWQVRTWGSDGRASDWSAPASFEMALLHASDWSARWIGNEKWLDRQPTPVTIKFPAQDARYLRITTTKLGQPLVEGSSLLYRLQLAEIVAVDSAQPGTDEALGATVTSSDPKIYAGKWEPRFLVDGTLTSNQAPFGYSSAGYSSATPTKPITLTIDLGQVKHVDELLLYPRTDTTTADGRTPNFPSDFIVSASPDGSSYMTLDDVHGQKEPPAYNLDFPALPLFAKQFTIDKPVRSARLYATGVGIYDARVNGDAVSKAVLQPANTDYHDRVVYSDNDVTTLLRQGANALSVRLGPGTALVPDTPDRYTKWSGTVSAPKMIAQLEITYADGSTQRIVSDDVQPVVRRRGLRRPRRASGLGSAGCGPLLLGPGRGHHATDGEHAAHRPDGPADRAGRHRAHGRDHASAAGHLRLRPRHEHRRLGGAARLRTGRHDPDAQAR